MNNDKLQATWIWYPDDYEIWLHRKVSVLRQYKGYICPPSWRLDDAYTCVKFRKTFRLDAPETLTLSVQGEFVLLMDGNMTPIPYERKRITSVVIPAGTHELTINVYNERYVPAIYATSDSCSNDGVWEVTALDGKWVKAASWQFHDIHQPPREFPFSYETFVPVQAAEADGGSLLDFGRETFGFLKFTDVKGKGTIRINYGESREEALAGQLAETFDELTVDALAASEYATPVTRAFRYVYVKADEGITYSQVEHAYEYLPMTAQGEFRSSDDKLNRIWDVSVHTIHLTMREFLYDGMKRDRWVWSGDANIGLMINNYVFFEQDLAKRTLIALRGKEPVGTHINTIMDFTFYWFLSLRDYYLYTGDLAFIEANYGKMLSLMEFCLNRRNEEGMMEGRPEDWVFIDWAPMDLRGEVNAEQILFCRSLETMALFAEKLRDPENRERFVELAGNLRCRIFELFWDETEGAMLHGRYQGEVNRSVLKYPNIFATKFGYLDERQRESVKKNVLLNDEVQKIKTPFMRLFELEALCLLGENEHVLNEIRSYWGGMLDLGATSFWEEFDPEVPADEQYDMYGDKFRKSLCHAWGAAPNLLLGKYVLGVRPLEPSYASYVVEPRLCDLEWIEGKVPTPNGPIEVYMDKSTIRIRTNSSGVGVLRFHAKSSPQTSDGELTSTGVGIYELSLSRPNSSYVIHLDSGERASR
ncbi:alpha-rhamnosidase [Cohnella soli]|uniref:Alpha-rhamnosidase n=1 Tax=Cohnella soli TaxID=425005 RepID=A0ABW0I0H6_9BACL